MKRRVTNWLVSLFFMAFGQWGFADDAKYAQSNHTTPIYVVELVDFTCRQCAQMLEFDPEIKQILEQAGGDLRVAAVGPVIDRDITAPAVPVFWAIDTLHGHDMSFMARIWLQKGYALGANLNSVDAVLTWLGSNMQGLDIDKIKRSTTFDSWKERMFKAILLAGTRDLPTPTYIFVDGTTGRHITNISFSKSAEATRARIVNAIEKFQQSPQK